MGLRYQGNKTRLAKKRTVRRPFKKLMTGLDEVEAHLKGIQRFRFVKDDDGHTYLIPAEKKDAFQLWVDAAPYWDGYEGEDFQEFETGRSTSGYTFLDPKVD